MELVFPLLFLLVVAAALAAKSIVMVPAGQSYIVDTLGRFNRVLDPGLHVLRPFLDTIRAKVPTTEQTLDVPPAPARLRDGNGASVKGTVRYRVLDPQRALNEVADYRHALAALTSTHWTRAIEQSDLTSFHGALDAAFDPIRGAAAAWGIGVLATSAQTDLSEAGVRELEARAAKEKDARVLEWLARRHEAPGRDGRPTRDQHAAYQAWAASEVEMRRDEIEAAIRDEQARAARRAPSAAAPESSPAAIPAPAALRFGVAVDAIAPRSTGRVTADGREWSARNESSAHILGGFRCVIDRQDGSTLIVRPL